jgi:hypothetical protein
LLPKIDAVVLAEALHHAPATGVQQVMTVIERQSGGC